MLASFRRSYAQLVTSGAQLFLLFAGIQMESASAWLFCLALMAVISLAAWLSALNRLRAIRGTPTSKIAAAAQGYVELTGQGEPFGDTPLLGKLTHLPCLWYRYKVEHRTSRDKWTTTDSGQSTDSFLLQDGSGVCVVDPENAEITTEHREHWRVGDYRYSEWKLVRQDMIYVLGEFRTQNSAAEFDSRAELNALLTEWKKDKTELHRRFDLNQDGKLSEDEWQLARQGARREVAKMQREVQAIPDLHIIGSPRDGKLFLISNLTPEKLSRRFLLWSWAHLLIFFGAIAGIGWILQHA